jgi:hypothetical protein
MTRLITNDTRPDLYAQLLEAQRAANDDAPLSRAEFRRVYRRHHPFLAFCAWCAESNWRTAGLIAAALVAGSILEKLL